MADITIQDLLVWEPRLQLVRRPLPGMSANNDLEEREISWAVTIRASAPMLQPLRGGELVLLPERIVSESGLAVPVLLRELSGLHAGAAVLERAPEVASPIPVLIAPEVSIEFETGLNRMLTERRGELYRAGTDLGRTLAGIASTRDLAAIIRTAGEFLSCPVALMSARGTILEQTGNAALPAGAVRAIQTMHVPREWREQRYLVTLAGGGVLWFGPVPAEHRALVRLAADRIALAVEGVLRRTVEERPRGPARSAALAAVLESSAEEAARAGALLGLAPDATYQVLLADVAVETSRLERALQPLGTAHSAGMIGDRAAVVLEARAERERRTPGHSDSVLDHALSGAGSTWLAASAPLRGVGQLPEAYRQSRYVAALMSSGAIAAGAVQFDRLADLGVYRLLYELWGMPALASYIEDALGPLRAGDKRGSLRETYLAYLTAGGSQTETAAALGIHRNTLTYRLRQIAQLLGHDPDDPRLRLAIHLALVAERLPNELRVEG
jgi:hypothetical protein